MNLKSLHYCKLSNSTNFECVMALGLFVYCSPLIIILGLLGNILSLVVLWRRPLIKTSSYIYLAAIALVDLWMILIGLKTYIEFIADVKVMELNGLMCKLHDFLVFPSNYLSTWLIVAMTIDRLIAVCFPLKAWNFSKPSRCKKIILLMTIVVYSTNSFWLFLNTYDKHSRKCQRPRLHKFALFDSIFYSFLPSTILIIGNSIIIYNVNRSNLKQKMFANIRVKSSDKYEKYLCDNLCCCSIARNREDSKSSKNGFVISERPIFLSASIREKRQLTILLVTVSILFLLLTMPVTLMAIYRTDLTRLCFLDIFFHMLSFSNHAINFIIYCSMGNKFRRQLKAILRGKKKRRSKGHLDHRKNVKVVFKDSTMRNNNPVDSGKVMERLKRRVCFNTKADSNIMSNDSFEIDTPIEFPPTQTT